MAGLTYPYTRHDRLIGTRLDLDDEFSPAPTPPSGTAGGAGRFKYWVDSTDVNNGILRQCVVTRATAGAYVAGEWITLGVIDAANHKFHFNTDNVDFAGGSGTLTVHDLTVTGTANLNILNVAGPANLNSLAVANYTALHNIGVTGDLTVTGEVSAAGALVGASLLVGGTITGTDLIINDNAHILGTLGIDGSLVVTGTITAGTITAGSIITSLITAADLSTSGNLTVAGKLTVNGIGSIFNQGLVIHPASGGSEALACTADIGVTGQVLATGKVEGNYLHSTGDGGVDGTFVASVVNSDTTLSVGTDATVNHNLIVGGDGTVNGNFAVAGGTNLHTVGTGDLTVGGNLGVTGACTLDGPVVCASEVTATNRFNLTHAGDVRQALYYGPDGGGNIGIALSGPTFSGTVGTQVDLYDNHNYYKAVRHEIQAEGDTPAVMAVFMDGSSSNQTGSWSIICDDTVKENVSAYSAGLADILKLNPVSFNYYVPASRGRDAERWSPFADPFGTVTPTTHFGLLASNVRDVLPEMAAQISYGDPGPSGLPSTPLWTISPTHLVWVLTNAVKELSTQDTDLDSRLTVVEGHTPPVITITGDITGSGTPTINAILPVVNSNPGTFQGLIINAKGQVTGASNMHYAPLASPIFTGTPTAPAPASRNDASLQLATTAFVRLGTTTNDDAPAGQLGEFVSGQLLSTAAVALSNNVDTSLATISLSAGEWEVWGSGGFALSANNATQIKVWINPTGATAAPALDQLGGLSIMPITNNVLQMIMPVTSMRVTLAATTTIRLGATATFTGSISAYGKIMARRVR